MHSLGVRGAAKPGGVSLTWAAREGVEKSRGPDSTSKEWRGGGVHTVRGLLLHIPPGKLKRLVSPS